jgi:hypothetical protein
MPYWGRLPSSKSWKAALELGRPIHGRIAPKFAHSIYQMKCPNITEAVSLCLESISTSRTQTKGEVMPSSNTKKFLVLYLVPAPVMDEWAKTDPEKKKVAEEKMQTEWGKWMGAHSKIFISTDVGGKTKLVTSSGVSDTRNDIVLYSIIEAASHDAAAKSFENHPHLQIPQSSIEVMEIRPMGVREGR